MGREMHNAHFYDLPTLVEEMAAVSPAPVPSPPAPERGPSVPAVATTTTTPPPPQPNKSIYRGVFRSPSDGLWMAQVVGTGGALLGFKGKYKSEEDAARAYDFMAKEIFGDEAFVNFRSEDDKNRGIKWALAHSYVAEIFEDAVLEQHVFDDEDDFEAALDAIPKSRSLAAVKAMPGAVPTSVTKKKLVTKAPSHQPVVRTAATATTGPAVATSTAPAPHTPTTATSSAKKSRSKAKSSPYMGVSKLNTGNWQARIRIKEMNIQLGTFPTEDEAAKQYDVYARKHHGDKATLNFPTKEDLAIGMKSALDSAPWTPGNGGSSLRNKRLREDFDGEDED